VSHCCTCSNGYRCSTFAMNSDKMTCHEENHRMRLPSFHRSTSGNKFSGEHSSALVCGPRERTAGPGLSSCSISVRFTHLRCPATSFTISFFLDSIPFSLSIMRGLNVRPSSWLPGKNSSTTGKLAKELYTACCQCSRPPVGATDRGYTKPYSACAHAVCGYVCPTCFRCACHPSAAPRARRCALSS
jgi:hypothetical protein